MVDVISVPFVLSGALDSDCNVSVPFNAMGISASLQQSGTAISVNAQQFSMEALLSRPIIISPAVDEDIEVFPDTDDIQIYTEPDLTRTFDSSIADNVLGNDTITYPDDGWSYDGVFRFNNLPIYKDAIIKDCYLKLYSRLDLSGSGVNCNIYLVDSANPILPADLTEYDALQLTIAINWIETTDWVKGERYSSVDISLLLQQIVNKEDWEYGNSIIIVVKDNGSTNWRNYYSTGYSPTLYRPAVHIEAYEKKTYCTEIGILVPCDAFALQTILNQAITATFEIQNPVILYYFTLTGLADGLEDITIPISSFQARYRNGESTYLSCVIPDISYLSEINSRLNGDMIIRMALQSGGTVYHNDEIMRVDLDTNGVRVDIGGNAQSITLIGHRTESFSTKTSPLQNVEYKRIDSSGKINYRCSTPDIYLRPGDTATYDSDSFTVGMISYSVSVGLQLMEVSEA